MKQGLLSWNPTLRSISLPTVFSIPTRNLFATSPRTSISVSATLESIDEGVLTAKERRQLRQERRERNSNNWREEVEEKLLIKPKKRYASWTEELNLDTLALLGPQWWVVRVSRANGQETSELLARLLARNFPEMEYKVYLPAVKVKRKLKNGTLSIKPKPLFPGCVFLRCLLNKEVHDFIREVDGVGGFVGSKVGNAKKQINKPRPVSNDDIEAMFRQAKEEQEKADQEFEEEQKKEENLNSEKLSVVYSESQSTSEDFTESVLVSKTKRSSRKASLSQTGDGLKGNKKKLPKLGSSVRVKSGIFAEFDGVLKKLDRKTGRATVGFTLFGKESLVELDINDIVVDTE